MIMMIILSTYRLHRFHRVLAVYCPEQRNDKQEIIELIGAMAPAAQHRIRYEKEMHEGNDLYIERERERVGEESSVSLSFEPLFICWVSGSNEAPQRRPATASKSR